MAEREYSLIRRTLTRSGAAVALSLVLCQGVQPALANTEAAKQHEPSSRALRNRYLAVASLGGTSTKPLTYCEMINGDKYCVDVTAHDDAVVAKDISFSTGGGIRQMTIELPVDAGPQDVLDAFSKQERQDLYTEISEYFGSQEEIFVHTKLGAPNTGVIVEPIVGT